MKVPTGDSEHSADNALELQRLVAELHSNLDLALTSRAILERKYQRVRTALLHHERTGRCGTFQYSASSRCLRGSAATFRLLGLGAETYGCTEDDWLDRVHPQDRAHLQQQLRHALAVYSGFHCEFRVGEDAEVKYLHCDGSPHLDACGSLSYFCVLTDLTEQRLADETRRALQAELSAACRLAAFGELAAAVVHEVSQPLTAITASAQAVRRWLNHGATHVDAARGALDGVLAQGERATAIVHGLKLLLRDEAAEPAPCDLPALVRESCALLEPSMRQLQVELVLHHAEELPLAYGNRTQLQQIFMNLARNALKAMQESPRPRLLSVTLTHIRDELALQVSDTGPGHTSGLVGSLHFREGCGVPVILMSGHADVPMSVRAMRAGAIDFIQRSGAGTNTSASINV